MNYYENFYSSYNYIAGVDEVGRGCVFGPVVACSVVLPKDFNYDGINDSKKLSAKKRDVLYEHIINNCIEYQISVIDNEIIDEINILEASKLAMYNSIRQMKTKLDVVLVDAIKLDLDCICEGIIKGDAKSYTIAAASIVAKVYRDRMLKEYANIYPYYDLENNMGYPTKKHLIGIDKYGITPLHRKTFAPVTNWIRKNSF